MKVARWKLGALRPLPYNPRRISAKDREQLRQSLDRFGLVEPLVVNVHKGRRGNIVGGFQRWRTLQEAGETEADVVEVDLDKDRERELNIRLNGNRGQWDYALFAAGFKSKELAEWGLPEEELAEFEAAVRAAAAGGESEEEGEEPPEDPVIELGDVLLFDGGKHRLLCGDSTGDAGLATGLDGAEPLLMVMDPPFEVEYSAWSIPPSVGVLAVWGRGKQRVAFESNLGHGWRFAHELVFTGQPRGVGGPSFPCTTHDLVDMWRRCKAAGFDAGLLRAAGARVSEDGRPFSVQESGLVRGDHGHGKGLLSMAVLLSHVPADSGVWDPCAGSGASLIAAAKHGRWWRGAELQPRWAELIARRWVRTFGGAVAVQRGEQALSYTLGEDGVRSLDPA